jgi:antitoxin component YwqK of YwqJK toxin-antitoxin module
MKRIIYLCILLTTQLHTAIAQDSLVVKSDYDTTVLCVSKYLKNKILFKYYEKQNGILHGKTVNYYPNSYIRNQVQYFKGALHGTHYYYNDEGALLRIDNYKKGLLHGRQLTFSKGYLLTDVDFVNGVYWGENLTNYEQSSFPKQVINYTNGLKNGEAKYYYKGNIIMIEQTYVNGKLEGISRSFYENGRVESVGNYNNNTENGAWNYFKEDGSFIKTVQFKNGVEAPLGAPKK